MRLIGSLLELLLRIFVTFLSDFPVLDGKGLLVSFVFFFIYYVSSPPLLPRPMPIGYSGQSTHLVREPVRQG